MIRRDHSFPDAIVAILVCVVVLAIGIVVLRAWTTSTAGGSVLRDANALKQIHLTFLIWSNDHAGVLPTPGLVPARHRAASVELHELNHTANLYSMMIALEYFNPDLVISSFEVNPHVHLKSDYNYDAFQPAVGSYWDDSFAVRLDDPTIGSNASYAHLAVCGDRQRLRWRNTQDSNMPVLGTRGTRGGVTTGPEYHRSPTLKLHGPANRWGGFIVLADNATERIERFTRRGTVFDDGQTVQADNMYAAEFAHPYGNYAAADAFLALFIEASEHSVTPVYDPLED